jgi:hypothetical protein
MNQLKPENFRYVAYRNVFFLLHGRTRLKMSRAPLPSCMILKIREMYPDPNNRYTGFRSKRQRTWCTMWCLPNQYRNVILKILLSMETEAKQQTLLCKFSILFKSFPVLAITSLANVYV